jgi:hypothetical protein
MVQLASTALLAAEPDLEARLRALVRPKVTWRSRMWAVTAVMVASLLTTLALRVPMARAAALQRTVLRSVGPGSSLGGAVRDPAWGSRMAAGGEAAVRSIESEAYFARTDSLLIDAIERTNPALMRLARTATPYVAVALTPGNEIMAHSISAGVPPGVMADSVAAALRIVEAATAAGLGTSGFSDARFRARMAIASNAPSTFIDWLGVSHLRVGTDPLTVLWVRFKKRA